jgi:Phage integrase family
LREAKGPYLFSHRQDPNKPLTTVRKAHLDAFKEAKIHPRFRLYDLRHTFGSRSAMAGVDLATLKELMGHSQISMTLRYVHPTAGTQARGGQEIGAVQRGTGFCVVRKAATVGVPTRVPTVRIEPMLPSFPKFFKKNGGPGESRTPDTRFRKPLLYPSELQAPWI